VSAKGAALVSRDCTEGGMLASVVALLVELDALLVSEYPLLGGASAIISAARVPAEKVGILGQTYKTVLESA